MSRAKVAVIGPTTRDDLFGAGSSPIGEIIRINGTLFTVIGITAAKGGSGFSNQDDMIFIPLSTMQGFLSGGDYVGTISIQAKNQGAMTDIQEAATALLLERHHIASVDRADFSILNQSDLVNTASSVTGTFTMLFDQLGRQPFRQRIIFKRIAEFFRCTERCMRIPVVNV